MTPEKAKQMAASICNGLPLVISYNPEAVAQDNGKYTIKGSAKVAEDGIQLIANAILGAAAMETHRCAYVAESHVGLSGDGNVMARRIAEAILNPDSGNE